MNKVNRREFLKLAGAAPVSLALWDKSGGASMLSNPSAALADPYLEIDLNNIAWNLAQIRQRVNGRPIMAVIKANAYGHGLVEIARFLEKQNVRFLAVGKVQEALLLREAGVKSSILGR